MNSKNELLYGAYGYGLSVADFSSHRHTRVARAEVSRLRTGFAWV